MDKFQLVNFFFKFSIIVVLFQITLLTIITPTTQKYARSLFKSSNVDYFEGLIKPKKFNDTIKDLTIFAEEKNDQGELKNIFIKKASNNEKFQITFSKKGVFEKKGNSKILVLYDGQTLSNNKGNLTNFNFSKSDFGLSDMSSHTVLDTKLQEQPSEELITCLYDLQKKNKSKIINCNTQNLRNIYKETFKRFVNPLYLPLLILITLMLILVSKENMKYNKYKILVYISGFIIIILSEGVLGYVAEDIEINLLLFFLPILITLFIYFIFFYKLKLKYRSLKT